MPLGSVTLIEFAEGVRDRLLAQTSVESVLIVESDPEDLTELRKEMGRKTEAYRICYDPEGSLEMIPALGGVVTYEFRLIVVCLFSRLGKASTRLGDSTSTDVTSLAKNAMASLEGQDLGILNTSKVSCGPARFLVDGDGMQALSFTVTGRSRESRS